MISCIILRLSLLTFLKRQTIFKNCFSTFLIIFRIYTEKYILRIVSWWLFNGLDCYMGCNLMTVNLPASTCCRTLSLPMRKDRWERLRKQFCLKNKIIKFKTFYNKMTYFKEDLVAGKNIVNLGILRLRTCLRWIVI